MPAKIEHWIVAHADLANEMFSNPMLGVLSDIRDRLERHGYKLKLDIGKRSTKATVTSKTLKAKSSYSSIRDFIAFENARLLRIDAALTGCALPNGEGEQQ